MSCKNCEDSGEILFYVKLLSFFTAGIITGLIVKACSDSYYYNLIVDNPDAVASIRSQVIAERSVKLLTGH